MNTAALKTQESKLSSWHLFWYEDCRAGMAESDPRPTVVRKSCLRNLSHLIRLLAHCPEAMYPLPVHVSELCDISIQRVSILFYSYRPTHLKALSQIALIQ